MGGTPTAPRAMAKEKNNQGNDSSKKVREGIRLIFDLVRWLTSLFL
jgi:hypothetical protein